MEVIPRFRHAINGLFQRMGVEVEYAPANGELPFVIRVIPRRPEQLFELGESQIHAEDPQFEFQVSDVPNPQRGDDIIFGDHIYRIESEPRLEQHQMVWAVDVLPL